MTRLGDPRVVAQETRKEPLQLFSSPGQVVHRRDDMGGETPAATILILCVLILFAGASWWIYLHQVVESDPHLIRAIPLDLAGWRGVDTPLEEGVEAMLRADANLQRTYRGDRQELVWLYVGYYGTARGGEPEHTPWACYPASGWEIVSSVKLPLADAGGSIHGGSVMELVVERAGARRLVHFWYATHRSTAVATKGALKLDHAIGRLSLTGRADGALVRISTPIDQSGESLARERLQRFAGPLVHALRSYWPKTA